MVEKQDISMMESDKEKIKKKRTVFRMVTTKLFNRIETDLSDEVMEKETKAIESRELQDQLSSKVENLMKLDAVTKKLTDIDLLETEILKLRNIKKDPIL